MAPKRAANTCTAGRGALVPTSFAVLFLRRKFQKVPAPITPGGLALDRLDASTPPAEFAACVLAQVRRGEAGLVTVVDQLRSSVPRRRYAALVSLQMIAGSTFGFRASAGSGDNAAALQRIEVWLLERRRGDR